MIKNWKVTATLSSPLAGEAPHFDSLLSWELANRLGMKHAKKLTRNTPITEIEDVSIPLSRKTINNIDVFCCSSPILSSPISEWVDYVSRRLDLDKLSLLLHEKARRSVLIASGPYKMRYAPTRIRLVEKVIWFVRGDRREIRKLIKFVYGIGKHVNIGYGRVEGWSFEETEKDYSILAPLKGKQVLMRPVPVSYILQNVTGYTKTFGAVRPPYWHPGNYIEMAEPC